MAGGVRAIIRAARTALPGPDLSPQLREMLAGEDARIEKMKGGTQ
jgi:hypothetical protein